MLNKRGAILPDRWLDTSKGHDMSYVLVLLKQGLSPSHKVRFGHCVNLNPLINEDLHGLNFTQIEVHICF